MGSPVVCDAMESLHLSRFFLPWWMSLRIVPWMSRNAGWCWLFSVLRNRVNTPKLKTLNDKGEHRQPAFHINAIEFIKKERDVVSIAVDTFSPTTSRGAQAALPLVPHTSSVS